MDLGSSLSEDIIYTLVKNLKDFGDISYGDMELSKYLAERTYEEIVGRKVTIKKAVSSTSKKNQKIPIVNLDSTMKRSSKKQIAWTDYVNDGDKHYGYTTQISFLDGQYPVYNFDTGKVIAAVGHGTKPRLLTVNDKKILIANGLEFTDD